MAGFQTSRSVRTLAAEPPDEPEACGDVRLWSYPKIVFFYPTFLTAIVAGCLTNVWPTRAESWAIGFMVVYGLNLCVISFDFPRTAALNYVFGGVALGLCAFVVNAHLYAFFPILADLSRWIAPTANDQFYWFVAGGLGLVYLFIILADRRFDYWTFGSLRIERHSGPWGDNEQYAAAGTTIQKDVTDVFEFLLLRSGRLIIHPQNAPSIVLENVPGINGKVRQIETLLGVVPVELARPSGGHHHVPPAAAD